MGCSSSEPRSYTKYMISYCSLLPLKGKENTFKINLLAQEEAEKLSEKKFFAQCGENEEKIILDFMKRENFNKNTIFYLYINNKIEIKNLFQMINLIPYNFDDLHKIVLLSTEKAEGFYNFLIEKKTLNLSYSKFLGSIIDLNDVKNIVENINNINLTQDNINNNENEEDEDDNTIYINRKKKKKKVFTQLNKFFLDKKIKIFSFSDTNINDIALFNPILQLLEKNYHLRNVTLRNCNLVDSLSNDLMRAISNKRLRCLNLSRNSLTVEGATLISEFLLVNKTLQELNLSNNDNVNFKSEGIKYIIRSLVQHPNIKSIDFSNMNLTGCGEFIANLIEKSKTLEKVILKNNYLNSNDFKNIFEKVKINNFIKEIDISYNDMAGDKSLEYISDSIKENTSLVKLNLNKININNDNYNIIFKGIEKNKNISFYSISYNKINPKIVVEFFIKQLQVKNLEYIPFDKNNPEDKNKDLTLDEKKLMEKFKTERPDINLIN